MKTKALYLLFGLSAGLALSACTDNDMAVVNGGSEGTAVSGGRAYMMVNIKDVGAMTRATSPGFEYGSSLEYAVEDAHFYFYDGDEVFVTEASVWGSGTANETEPAQTIEWEGNTLIVLDNLESNNYPKYMVTVLNKPTNFTAPASLSKFETALADATKEGIEGIIQDTENLTDFTMSTSSYMEDSDERPEYFVNTLTTDNFSEEPIEGTDDVTPVTVYVERLAVKVTLNISSDLMTDNNAITVNDDTLYKITHAVTEVGQDGTTTTDDKPIYIRFDGWKLNATARYSNMVKDIKDNASWTNTGENDLGTGWTWNDASNFRSYWGKSFNYGEGGYPSSSLGKTDENESDLSDYLDYTSLSSGLYALGGHEYCAENTNTAGENGIIQSKNSSAITSVLLKATICNEYGTPVDMYIRYLGELWTPESYIKHALADIESENGLNIWYENPDYDDSDPDSPKYFQIDDSYLTIGAEDSDYDGSVRIVLVDDTTQFYSLDADNIPTELSNEEIQNILDIYFNNVGYAAYATAYNGGEMYYNIPIEHLNNNSGTDSNGNAMMLEANYGVVRNHHYVLTVTTLEGLGHGIFNPDEVIIPQEEKTTYYVSAQVNILSWKLVEQDVSL